MFLMFKHRFGWKCEYNIYIYIFISVSGCVGMGPIVLLCHGAYDAVKTAMSKFQIKLTQLIDFIQFQTFGIVKSH